MAEAGPGRRRDRWYAPTVLAGLAGAALAAVAGTRDWASGHGSAAGIRVEATVPGSNVAPLVGALGLVALAAWGVVLVTRGQVRRGVSVVGLLACGGALVAAALGLGDAQGAVVDALVRKGATSDAFATSLTPWCYLALLGAVLGLGAFAVAVVRAPAWPAMGSRYDAPGGRPRTGDPDRDMWRALDEGRDPTSRPES